MKRVNAPFGGLRVDEASYRYASAIEGIDREFGSAPRETPREAAEIARQLIRNAARRDVASERSKESEIIM